MKKTHELARNIDDHHDRRRTANIVVSTSIYSHLNTTMHNWYCTATQLKLPKHIFPQFNATIHPLSGPNSSCYGTNSTTVRVEVHNSLLRVLAKTLPMWQRCVGACPHKAQHRNLDLIQGRESLPFSCDLEGWRLHFLLMETCVL